MVAKVTLHFFLVLGAFWLQGQGIHLQSFGDLVDYLDRNTTYQFLYPPELVDKELDINTAQDPSLTELKHLLEPSGIALKAKGGTLFFSAKPIKKSNRIYGYILDHQTGEALIGAHVIDLRTGKGVTSNIYGFFALNLEGDTVLLRSVGYEDQPYTQKQLETSEYLYMHASIELLEEVVVEGTNAIYEQPTMSSIKLKPQELEKVPLLLGEADVLKTLQYLPGVQSGLEGTSGIYVRGGGPDQNLFLLDGVPVYNANHLFGFFSTFNPDAIKHVDLIKGGFPARYGGRLSSVVDIQMKEGNKNDFQGNASLGLIASKLLLEGPIGKNKATTFMLSGRRTYFDLFTVPIARAANSNRVVGYNFGDYNAKINHQLSRRDRIYLSFYTGRDKYFDDYTQDAIEGFREKEDAFIQWGNVTSSVRWNRRFNDKLFGNLTAIFSNYRFDLGTTIDYQYAENLNLENVFRENTYFSSIRDYGLKADFDYYLNNSIQIRAGVGYTNHILRPGISTFRSHLETDTTFGSTKAFLQDMYTYWENDLYLTPSTSVNAGVHYSVAIADNTVYQSLQPRITVNQKILPALSVKVSYAPSSAGKLRRWSSHRFVGADY